LLDEVPTGKVIVMFPEPSTTHVPRDVVQALEVKVSPGTLTIFRVPPTGILFGSVSEKV